MTLTPAQRERMAHVNPHDISQDDYEYVMGSGQYSAICPACGGLEAEFLERASEKVCTMCGTNWQAMNRSMPS